MRMNILIIFALVAVAIAILLLLRSSSDRAHGKGGDWAAQQLEKEYGSLGMTIDDLLALEGSKSTHTILFAIEYKIGQKLDALGPSSLSDAERKFYAIEGVEREVNNGGVDFGESFVVPGDCSSTPQKLGGQVAVVTV